MTVNGQIRSGNAPRAATEKGGTDDVATRNFRSLEPGQKAPGFTLPAFPDGRISLADYRGQMVLLVFYMGNFIKDPIPDQMMRTTAFNLSALSADTDKFDALGIQVLAVARESRERHAALSRPA
jgi:peroxiredoxin